MITQTFRSQNKRNLASPIVFILGFGLLIGTWVVLFWWVSLFTGALLVPWYCCVLETAPALGTWQRTINDFFAVFPGNILPSTAFILIEIIIIGSKMLRTPNRSWLPVVFALANCLLLAADLIVTNFFWALSDWLVGPREGIDAGFHRTWYGIVAHLILWYIFFVALAKTKFPQVEANAQE